MANILIYDPSNASIPNRANSYLMSVNSPDYAGVASKIINPDLSSVVGVLQKYWKVVDGQVFEMDSAEKNVVEKELDGQRVPNKTYSVTILDSGKRLFKETWYAIDNGDGTYSQKAQETTYNYTGNSLISKSVVSYYCDGSVQSSETWNYYSGENGETIMKQSI